MTKQRYSQWFAFAFASATLAFALLQGTAAAQDVCIAPTNSAPGEGAVGAPKWLAADTHGGPAIKWLNDIRWSDAAQDVFGDLKNDASYRVVYDNDYLLVSIQAKEVAADRTPNTQSRVYFAVGHQNNDRGAAIAINLRAPATTTPANSPTAVVDVQSFTTVTTTKVCRDGGNDGTTCTTNAQCTGGGTCKNDWAQATPERGGGFPAWLVAPAVWVNESLSPRICVNDTDPNDATNKNADPCTDANEDGQAEPAGACGATGVCVQNDPSRSLWGVNFKIKLQGTNGLGIPPTDALKMYVGTRMVSVTPMAARIYKRLPVRAVTPPAAQHLFDTANIDDAMVPRNMALWATSTPPTVPCNGASVVRTKIGRQTAAGNFDLVDLQIPSGAVTSTLIATVDCPNGCPPDSLKAKFRVANWGSNFNDLGWSPLVGPGSVSQVSLQTGQHFSFPCKPNTGTTTCGLLNTGLNPPTNGYYHQCMAVDLDVGSDSQVKVGAGSEYVNTSFQVASTIQKVATIDVRGLAAKTGNNLARNVYLYVTRKNMPAPSTRAMYLPRTEMVADRLEALDLYSCESQNEDVSCVALDGPVGLCAYPCSPTGTCQEGDAEFQVSDQCFCAENGESADICYAAAPDNRDERNVTPRDVRLERTWPTYEVLAYYDTGRTVKSGTVTYKVLETMTEFGMYIDHVGAHHGFTDSLTGLNGLTVTRVATDLYRISVPSEQKATMQVTVTAQESSSVVPLTVISGAAASFGVFGAVEVVGIAPALYPLDLRRSTARLDRLMNENGRELVRNLGAPRSLSPLPGALPTIATFLNTTGVDVSMEVIQLPLLGRLTTVVASGAAVDTPTGCPFAIGVARLSTSFSINDTVNPVFATEAQNEWACIPFVGMLAL